MQIFFFFFRWGKKKKLQKILQRWSWVVNNKLAWFDRPLVRWEAQGYFFNRCFLKCHLLSPLHKLEKFYYVPGVFHERISCHHLLAHPLVFYAPTTKWTQSTESLLKLASNRHSDAYTAPLDCRNVGFEMRWACIFKKKERKTRRNGVPGNELQKDKPTNQQRVAW